MNLKPYLPKNDWHLVFSQNQVKRHLENIANVLETEERTVYPTPKNMFRAFDLCPMQELRVVILGQDPYHNEGQANGLAFSVDAGIPLPPSLKNIYTEIKNDLQITMSANGDLSHWAKQGVLLLNASLSVVAHQPNSHAKIGWHDFTDAIIQYISENKQGIVFVLWGNFAKQKQAIINAQKHLVLCAGHPSPFSAYRGFFNCRHFSKINFYLQQQQQKSILWQNS